LWTEGEEGEEAGEIEAMEMKTMVEEMQVSE
jgi:hypothetical protein